MTTSRKAARGGTLRRSVVFVLLLLLVAVLFVPGAAAQDEEDQPKVHAVLFFLTTCGHCEYVIYEVLLPVVFPENGGDAVIHYDPALEEAGEEVPFYLVTNGSLEMLFVNAGGPIGNQFFLDASEAVGVPAETIGTVPLLIVDDSWYLGSSDIPAYFPGIVEEGLAGDGVPWPDVPGIEDAVGSVPLSSDGTVVTTVPDDDGTIPEAGETMWDKFGNDQPANSIALVVLLLMVGSLIAVAIVLRRRGGEARFDLLVPALALIGLGIAIYLAYIESSGAEAVCGPVGDCNAVQQSKYAELFAVIPIGILGIAGYAVSLLAWLVARLTQRPLSDWARVALFGGAVGGTVFSVYLTFLEPFVIGATCVWCVGSAVVVTLLMWLTVHPAADSWGRLRPSPAPSHSGGSGRKPERGGGGGGRAGRPSHKPGDRRR